MPENNGRVTRMKRVYVNEDVCLGCHLCEYYCAFSHSGKSNMIKAFNGPDVPQPRIQVEEGDGINFAVSCRHCENPMCVKSCITGAMHIDENGTIVNDEKKCVGCWTCVVACPYGAIVRGKDKKVAKKCDLCTESGTTPACVAGCPNNAVVFEDRG